MAALVGWAIDKVGSLPPVGPDICCVAALPVAAVRHPPQQTHGKDGATRD